MMEGFEWNRLRQILLGWDPCADGCGQQQAATDERRFYLSGHIDRDDNWEPIYGRLVDVPIPVDPPPERGSHAVLVEDAMGRELVRHPVDVTWETADGPTGQHAQINVTLPYPDDAALVRVVHGQQTVAQLRPPRGEPTVQLQSVDVRNDWVTAHWRGQHPQGADLLYSVFFSPDNGRTRLPLATGLTETFFVWETDLAEGTDHARVIVEASDGFHVSEDMSDVFAIPHRQPYASIQEPYVGPPAGQAADGGAPGGLPEPTVLVTGQPIQLLGMGFDLNDGLLDGEDLRWASDRQGALGIGSRLYVALDAGHHRLRLQAHASSGLIGEATVDIEVLADQDGDGMPDQYEDEHGCLDSRNPEDRDEDWDRDLATALSEFRLGTNPCRADSDGDGINDGDEILGGSAPGDRESVPLPALAQQPDPVELFGCGRLPAPLPRRVQLRGVNVRYAAATDSDWIQAERQDDGSLVLTVDCGEVLAGPATASVLLTAENRQPMILPVTLSVADKGLYLPLIRRR
jgi:hypothetical protein